MKLKHHQDYWKRRALRRSLLSEITAEEQVERLEIAYTRTIQDIDTEIRAFYQRYSTENNLTLSDTLKRLNPKELKTFQEQERIYLDEIEKYKHLVHFKPVERYLKSLSAKAYISKLDQLKRNVIFSVEKLQLERLNMTQAHLINEYQNQYYTTIYDIDSFTGVHTDFTQPSKHQILTAVNEQYLGENYSSRIWKNKQLLVNTLTQYIPREFARGTSPNKLAEMVSSVLGADLNRAKTLIRTETNKVANKATIDAYKESDVLNNYRFFAVLDTSTTEICRAMDYKVFPLDQAEQGVNFPPLHPNCRSTTIPDIELDDGEDYITERVARNTITGKNYNVQSVSYFDWVDAYTPKAYAKASKSSQSAFKRLNRGKIPQGNIDRYNQIKKALENYPIEQF